MPEIGPTVNITEEIRATRRLTVLYVAALSMVALLSITGQAFVQMALNTQSSDSRVVNIAGRQRMLSQRLSKAALVIGGTLDANTRADYANELQKVTTLWERSHRGLQHGDAEIGLPGSNSDAVTAMFAAIEPQHQSMLAAARAMLDRQATAADKANAVTVILRYERSFVEGMDKIVFQYDKEAKARVDRLKLIEMFLLSATLLILSLEGYFVFRPAVRKVTEGIERLKLSNHEIEQKNIALSRSEAEISEKNARIIDSLLYAERIQQVILPSRAVLVQHFPECFILFHPKDIVSGDFYWFCENDGYIVLAVGDCTGHGVPGALMAMFGHALLSQIVVEKKILVPAAVLDQLHLGIRKALKQDSMDNDASNLEAQDGMDVAICVIDPARQTLRYAGARRPLYYLYPSGELQEIKADRKGAGGRQKEAHRAFTEHRLAIQPGMTLYLTTDGFSDQPDAAGVKYGASRLKQFLQTHASDRLTEQFLRLEQELGTHQGSTPQRDDITVVGVKIAPVYSQG